MKYRTRPAEHICSLEELFTEHLGLNIPIVPQTSSYSNKHTFSQLFFSQNPNQYDDIDKIMSFSVFKDADIERLKKDADSAQKPLYYLIHPDESYPTGTKLSVFFSNMANKNFSGNEQPLPIRALLNAIDYDKLCAHLDNLIETRGALDSDFIVSLQSYLSNVLSTDNQLTHYCSLFKCTSPSEYLATILLYALFDDVNFPAYASEVAITRNIKEPKVAHPVTDLNNPHFQKLMNDARRVDKLQAFATYTLIVLYSVQMLATIFSSTWISSYEATSTKGTLFSIVMLCASIILTALRFIPFSLHKKYSELSLILEHSVLDENSNTYSITYNHFQNCSRSFNDIQQGRRVIITLFCMMSILYIVVSFVFNSFPLLVALVSLSFGGVMLIDSMVHDHITYKRYDAFFSSDLPGHVPASRFGVARMCSWDYDSRLNSFRHTSYNKLTNYSEDCIRHIYDQVADSSKYSWATLTAFIVTLSSIGVIAEILQLVNPDLEYFRMPNASMLYSVTMILILLNGVLNILILLRARSHYHKMAEFSFYAGNPDSDNYEVTTLFRHNLYAGSISELAIARGIYNYNLCQFEQSLSTSDIQPPDDRYHPMYIVNQKLHLITDVALCIFVAYLSMAVWHSNNLRNLIGLPILVAVYALWTFAMYPLFKYRKIKSSIRKLNVEHKNKETR